MKRTHTFIDEDDANRYTADNILLPQGFCQVDTAQDFEHYGNWLHLDRLKAVTYAEGDLIQFEFEDETEIKSWLEGLVDLKHIDVGISNREHNLARAAALGIAEYAA